MHVAEGCPDLEAAAPDRHEMERVGMLHAPHLDDAERALEPSWETKSMGREHTFLEDTGDWEEVARTLDSCVADVHEQMINFEVA